jgi:hypothetical protein
MLRRYRLSGVAKFYDDQYTYDTEEDAKDKMEKIINSVNVSLDGNDVEGGVKLIESKMEDLGPVAESDDFYPPAGPPEDW